MLEQISPLWDVYLKNQHNKKPLVLATLTQTTGSSYKKAGAMMLIETDGATHGLLSGGCLESDVAEHAKTVFSSKQPVLLNYDLSDESIFGLGAGCDGSIEILLQLLTNDYLPFSALNPLPNQSTAVKLSLATTKAPDFPIASFIVEKDHQVIESINGFAAANQQPQNTRHASHGCRQLTYSPPPNIAICGAGVDAIPLVKILQLLHWHVAVIDHRSGLFSTELFHPNTQRLTAKLNDLDSTLGTLNFDAVVIMNHNLERDGIYLKHFAVNNTPWLGLLGPLKRRDKVLAKAGLSMEQLGDRLHAPVGLNLGGQMSENIAVCIAAQLQQFFYLS